MGIAHNGDLLVDKDASKAFLQLLWPNIDWDAEHYKKTPERFAKMLRELTTPEPFEFTSFESAADEMVIVKNINFTSLCAHHIVPYMGRCHIAYVPAGRIAGLSKFPRLVKMVSKNLSVQEELTNNIANLIMEHLDPKGVAVVMEAEHLCMKIRGVEERESTTVTSSMKGVFADHSKQARAEFLHLIKG